MEKTALARSAGGPEGVGDLFGVRVYDRDTEVPASNVIDKKREALGVVRYPLVHSKRVSDENHVISTADQG